MRANSISTDHIYSLESFTELTGFGDAAMRAARKNGLRVLRAHGRAFVYGRDFLDYLSRVNAVGSDGAWVTDPQPAAPSLAALFGGNHG